MEIEYTSTDNYKNEPRQTTEQVAEFLYNEILFTERYNSCSKEKVRLEDQPKLVCQAIGRLVEKLLDKDVLNLEDFKYISGCDWGSRADSLKLKRE